MPSAQSAFGGPKGKPAGDEIHRQKWRISNIIEVQLGPVFAMPTDEDTPKGTQYFRSGPDAKVRITDLSTLTPRERWLIGISLNGLAKYAASQVGLPAKVVPVVNQEEEDDS